MAKGLHRLTAREVTKARGAGRVADGGEAPNDPGAGVTEGNDGAFYGVTFSGSPFTAPGGTVFRLTVK